MFVLLAVDIATEANGTANKTASKIDGIVFIPLTSCFNIQSFLFYKRLPPFLG
jgi:hypothetical protein